MLYYGNVSINYQIIMRTKYWQHDLKKIYILLGGPEQFLISTLVDLLKLFVSVTNWETFRNDIFRTISRIATNSSRFCGMFPCNSKSIQAPSLLRPSWNEIFTYSIKKKHFSITEIIGLSEKFYNKNKRKKNL